MSRRGNGEWQRNRFEGWDREQMLAYARQRIEESDKLTRLRRTHYTDAEHWGRLLGDAWRHCERNQTVKEVAAA